MVFIWGRTCKQYFSNIHPFLSGTPCVMNAVYSAALLWNREKKGRFLHLLAARQCSGGRYIPSCCHSISCPISCSASHLKPTWIHRIFMLWEWQILRKMNGEVLIWVEKFWHFLCKPSPVFTTQRALKEIHGTPCMEWWAKSKTGKAPS